jgi:6-pyruvoyltetrahydropterin/6-carboxytetrahydropterin synthase
MSGTVYFGRRYALSASHRLHSDALTAAENQAAYGKCNNPYGHGHNYTIEVLVGGLISDETGMVLNLVDVDAVVEKLVMRRFDHTNLNLDPLFVNRVPTTENLCKAVFELLNGAFEPAKLDTIRVEETENNFFEYSGA